LLIFSLPLLFVWLWQGKLQLLLLFLQLIHLPFWLFPALWLLRAQKLLILLFWVLFFLLLWLLLLLC
jgi:hypothetical protein